jgi:hypothetical protein
MSFIDRGMLSRVGGSYEYVLSGGNGGGLERVIFDYIVGCLG